MCDGLNVVLQKLANTTTHRILFFLFTTLVLSGMYVVCRHAVLFRVLARRCCVGSFYGLLQCLRSLSNIVYNGLKALFLLVKR